MRESLGMMEMQEVWLRGWDPRNYIYHSKHCQTCGSTGQEGFPEGLIAVSSVNRSMT